MQDKSFCDNISLLKEARSGDATAEETLIDRNMGLVHGIARRFCGRGLDYDDIVQIGVMGLLKAIRSFDADRGFAFSTYAVPLVIGEIKRNLRDGGQIKVARQQKKLGMELLAAKSRIMNDEGRDPALSEIAEACGVSREEAVFALDAVTPVASLNETSEDGRSLEDRLADEDDIEKVRTRVALFEAISKLPPDEKKIITLRFFRNMTQQGVAKVLGISQVKVSREEKKIHEFLRHELL